MIELSTIRDVVAIAGVLIALTYYIINIRNQRETRQAQLFMNLYDTRRNSEFQKQYTNLCNRTWTNPEEWNQKYGPITNPDASSEMQSVMEFYNGAGVLLKRGLINIEVANDLLYGSTKRIWEQFEPSIRYIRTQTTWNPDTWIFFEYLYLELMKYHETHQESILK